MDTESVSVSCCVGGSHVSADRVITSCFCQMTVADTNQYDADVDFELERRQLVECMLMKLNCQLSC